MFPETGSFQEPPPNSTQRSGRGKSLHCLINSVNEKDGAACTTGKKWFAWSSYSN
jgi:hypothetical protein